MGTLVVLVAVQVSVPGTYFPPVFKKPVLKSDPCCPPQTIISPPVQTAVGRYRPLGALLVDVAVQLSVPGLYLPPVRKPLLLPVVPPQTIISVPVQTAV